MVLHILKQGAAQNGTLCVMNPCRRLCQADVSVRCPVCIYSTNVTLLLVSEVRSMVGLLLSCENWTRVISPSASFL